MPDSVRQWLTRCKWLLPIRRWWVLPITRYCSPVGGSEYRISDSAAPIRNAAGEIVGVVLVFSDITERYQAERICARPGSAWMPHRMRFLDERRTRA